jgi:hypothetical protein
MLTGAKLDLTPLGIPLIENATAELKPLTRVVVNVTGIDPPGATVALVALHESVKVPKIVRLSVCVLLTPPPVAVTVSVKVPAGTVEPATSDKVLVPAPGEAILTGENVAVTPAGTPLIDRATGALNPFTGAVVKVMGADPPGAKLTPVDPDDSVKLAGCDRVRLRV